MKNVESKDEPTHTTSDVNKLQKELAESRARIKELETSYKTLQVKYSFSTLFFVLDNWITNQIYNNRMQASKR